MNAFAALAPLRDKLLDGQEDLAADLIEKIGWLRLDRVTTRKIADEAAAWLRKRIDATVAVIKDECRRPGADRDQEWLAGADEALCIALDAWSAVLDLRWTLERAA